MPKKDKTEQRALKEKVQKLLVPQDIFIFVHEILYSQGCQLLEGYYYLYWVNQLILVIYDYLFVT